MAGFSCLIGLLMLMDVSGSVNQERYDVQKQGYIQALSDPKVEEIILKNTPFLISMIHWSGKHQFDKVFEWTIINNKTDVQNLINKINVTRRSNGGTALHYSIQQGIDYFSKAPCDAERKIIDVSGDGKDSFNNPELGKENKERAEQLGITINGLAIEGSESDILETYQNIITYDGFVVSADHSSVENFVYALRKKLIMEIAINKVSFSLIN